MEQVWLFFSLLGLLTGFGLISALILLKKMLRVSLPPILLPAGALILMGLSSLLGIYLRIEEIPRSLFFYRSINAGAWGFAVYATLQYLNKSSFLKKKKAAAEINSEPFSQYAGPGSFLAGVLVLVIAFLAAHPTEEGLLFTITDRLPALLMLGIEVATGALAIATGAALLTDAGKMVSRPWKTVFRGLGIALLILIPANLLEYLVSFILQSRGGDMKDGFVFAFGYGISNIVLIFSLLEAFHSRRTGKQSFPIPPGAIQLYSLTRREAEIVEKLLSGCSDREIAEELFISPRTVDTHLRSIFRKCGVTSRLQLTRLISDYGEIRSS